MQILLRHNTTNFTKYYDGIDIISSNPLHTLIEIDMSMLFDGEYTLTLLNDANEVLATELVQIGSNQIKEYNTKKKYTQYARR